MHSHLSPVTVCHFLQFRSRGRLLLSSLTELDMCVRTEDIPRPYFTWQPQLVSSRRHYVVRLRGRMDGPRLSYQSSTRSDSRQVSNSIMSLYASSVLREALQWHPKTALQPSTLQYASKTLLNFWPYYNAIFPEIFHSHQLPSRTMFSGT
jgi:hypothetical protein